MVSECWEPSLPAYHDDGASDGAHGADDDGDDDGDGGKDDGGGGIGADGGRRMPYRRQCPVDWPSPSGKRAESEPTVVAAVPSPVSGRAVSRGTHRQAHQPSG